MQICGDDAATTMTQRKADAPEDSAIDYDDGDDHDYYAGPFSVDSIFGSTSVDEESEIYPSWLPWYF